MTDLKKNTKSIVVHFAHICAYGAETVKELDALAREVTSADIASSDGGSFDDMPDSN